MSKQSTSRVSFPSWQKKTPTSYQEILAQMPILVFLFSIFAKWQSVIKK
jgi:hypothetical protein